MKKLLSVLFAVLLGVSITGLAIAHQGSYDPRTNDGGAYITVPVYNNSGSDLDPGDVVIWDIDASTGDNDLYVNTTTTANTGLVAGVVWPKTIVSASEGSIAIWGQVECDTTTPVNVDTHLCTSGTAGGGTKCTAQADEAQAYAIITVEDTTAAGSQVNCFVNP